VSAPGLTAVAHEEPPPRLAAPFGRRRWRLLALAALGLAAFNLTFRIGSEIVTEWDESLYAITAAEMVESGDWIGTTFLGTLDYYNAKPPLNVWLIGLAFKTFGISLITLRLVSVTAAWSTVALLMWWSRRLFGLPVAALAGLALGTSFGFLYVHAGRSGNTDALFALLILLAAVSLWSSRRNHWHRVWFGLIAAAVFLLKGTAVLMPLGIATAVSVLARRRHRRNWRSAAAAAAAFAIPVAAWAVARWQVDEWRFLATVVGYEFAAHSLRDLEDHPGGWLYYLNILAKHHYDWLLAGLAAFACSPISWSAAVARLRRDASEDGTWALLLCYGGVTLLVPTLMRTKLPWYLNAFYPAFALGMGWIIARGLARAATDGRRRARILLVGLVVLAAAVAEGKLIWYSYHHRDLRQSAQGLLLDEGDAVAGRRVFRNRWDRAEIFVIRHVLKAERALASDVDDFLSQSQPGDYFLSSHDVTHPELTLAQAHRRYRLYRRNGAAAAPD
jgi:4-amino-4-deoxy-L-arabinose transferase-like glycosyltransferase